MKKVIQKVKENHIVFVFKNIDNWNNWSLYTEKFSEIYKLEAGLGLETGLESNFQGLGLGLGLGRQWLGLGLGTSMTRTRAKIGRDRVRDRHFFLQKKTHLNHNLGFLRGWEIVKQTCHSCKFQNHLGYCQYNFPLQPIKHASCIVIYVKRPCEFLERVLNAFVFLLQWFYLFTWYLRIRNVNGYVFFFQYFLCFFLKRNNYKIIFVGRKSFYCI